MGSILTVSTPFCALSFPILQIKKIISSLFQFKIVRIRKYLTFCYWVMNQPSEYFLLQHRTMFVNEKGKNGSRQETRAVAEIFSWFLQITTWNCFQNKEQERWIFCNQFNQLGMFICCTTSTVLNELHDKIYWNQWTNLWVPTWGLMQFFVNQWLCLYNLSKSYPLLLPLLDIAK